MAPQKKAKAETIYGDLGVAELIMSPVGLIVAAALSLFAFNNVLRVIGTFSSKAFAKTGGWQKAVQPYFEMAKPVLDNVFGATATTSGFKLELTHFLLVAVLIALLGIWRSVHINGQLAKASLARLEAGEGAAAEDRSTKRASAKAEDK